MTIATPAPPARTASESTIASPLQDALWIVLCPLLAWLAMQALWRFSGASDLTVYAVLFAFIVTGHHMPGWLRAFGEPRVYERHKAQLWVSFAAIPPLVIVPTAYGFGALALCVAAAFDLWHVAMQQHGFGRIYAAKRGEVDRVSARLDLACVLTWYGTVVVWSDSWMAGIAAAFRRAGLPLFDAFTPDAWAVFRWTALAASLVLLATYSARALVLWRRERRLAANKHVLHAVAFAVLIASYQDASWYRAQSVQNLFHALQYFFMVWIYGHLSVRRDPTRPRGFYRALFGSRRGIVLFAGAIGLYGLGAWVLGQSSYRLAGWSEERVVQVIGSIGIASLLLHYYVDSFIWKVRSKEVQRTLGIRAGEGQELLAPRHAAHLRGALHAATYFGVPILMVALLGAGRRTPGPEEELALLTREAALFPGSAAAHFDVGVVALGLGRAELARDELLEAQRLSPSSEGPAFALAGMARDAGDREAEIRWLREAIAVAPSEPNLHLQLGIALFESGDLERAERELFEVLRLDPDYAGAHLNLATIQRRRGRVDLALAHLQRAHELEPDRTETVLHLAGALAALGRGREALELLAAYRSLHPEDEAAADFERRLRERL